MKHVMKVVVIAGVIVQMSVGLTATSIAAENRTITEPETVEADATYGRLLVNADLTVAAGVKLTCDTLCVASNIVGSATLTLEENAVCRLARDCGIISNELVHEMRLGPLKDEN